MSAKKPLSPIVGSHKAAGGRSYKRLVILLLLCIVMYRASQLVLHQLHQARHHAAASHTRRPAQRGHELFSKMAWTDLSRALQEFRPESASVEKTKELPTLSLESTSQYDDTLDVISMRPKVLETLTKSHARFVARIQSKKLSTVYQQGRQGIVIPADETRLPQILIQLRLLRRTGSNLPVEVFLLSSSDYDRQLCDKTLRKLGATCRILEDLMASSPMPQFAKGQRRRSIKVNEPLHKYLSIFFSSFEDVLMLDAYTLVFNNPDIMLREEPFLSSGLILWPDFWQSSVSPQMAKIQNKPVTMAKDNIRTIDAAQMIISKSEQSGPLVLAIYYAFFGAQLYDDLLMQSGGGEAGSQAIKAAAKYLDSSYYLVRRFAEAFGYPDPDNKNEFHYRGMVQHFPSDDYHKLPKDQHRPVFLKSEIEHPANIIQSGHAYFEKSKKAHRMWDWFGPRHASNGWRDTDPERALWEEISQVACADAKTIRAWPRPSSKDADACRDIVKYREEVAYGVMQW